MKPTTLITGILLAATLIAMPFTSRADDEKKTEKLKPYPLDTCLVCDMQLSHMGKPLMFEFKGREIKVCDKTEKRMFDKDPAKYMKKLEEAEAKEKK